MEGELPCDAVCREVLEETGLTVVVVCQIGGPLVFESEDNVDIATCFQCVALRSDTPVFRDGEATSYCYVQEDDIYLENGWLRLKNGGGSIITTPSRRGMSRMGRMVFDWFSTRREAFLQFSTRGTPPSGRGTVPQLAPSGDGRLLVCSTQFEQTYWKRIDPYQPDGYM